MNTLGQRSMSVLTVWALVVSLVSAQITFSRDWTGGKRSAPLAVDCTQLTRVCRHFIHELKQAMSPESVGKQPRRPDATEDITTYDDDK